jgi:HD-like signal output (HDOD) protein
MDKLSFDLPGISPVGLDLIALLNSPQATVKQIATQAKLDPVIFGSIIACANSSAYQGVNKSTDILTSLVRLGQREIKRIVYQVVLRSAFFHEVPEINTIMRRIWQQSLTSNIFMQKYVAAVPEACPANLEGMEHLECLGLLHNLGYVVLLINFQDRFLDFFRHNSDLALDEFFDEEKAWFDDFDHFSAGRALLDEWNFPRSLWEIVGQYRYPSQDFRGEYPLLHSLLRLSRHVVSMTEYNFHPTAPADFWIRDTDLPAVEVDFERLIEDVRESVQMIEGTFA